MSETGQEAKELKQAKTKDGQRALERIEKSLLGLGQIVVDGCDAGMLSVCERDKINNRLGELYYGVCGVHCDLTGIAERNGCDMEGGQPVAWPFGGPGRD